MFFILTCFLLVVLYFYGIRNHGYWKKKGVPYEEPLVLFGSNLKMILDGKSFSERFMDMYNRYPNEKYVGYFQANEPMLLVRDPELIKHVLTTDFRHFHHRGLRPHVEITEPLMKNVFIIEGDFWKLTRQKLSPVFSSGKLKAMFPIIVTQAEKLISIVDDNVKSGKEVDIRDLMARYTTDFIGACGFGVNSDSLQDESSEFRQLGKRIFRRKLRDKIIGLLKLTSPWLSKNMHIIAPEITNSILNLVKTIMADRNHVPSGRHDFIDYMIELKMKGSMEGESIEEKNADGTPVTVSFEIDNEFVAAQAFVFFAAGFETSSSTSSFLLHLLAYHPEVQIRCQREVDKVLKEYDGKLCYDAVKDMKYLEMAFRESLRVLPPIGFITRKSTTEYTFPGTDLTIDEGTGIIIPVQSLQRDEKYFKNPEEFIPERFHPDKIAEIEKFTLLPFGDGPRACIGERMGLMQALAGIATVLSRCSVSPSPNTIRTPRMDPTSTVVSNVIGGLPLLLTPR